MKTDKMEEKD